MKKVLQISIGEYWGGIEKLELEYMEYLNATSNDDLSLDILVSNMNSLRDGKNKIEKNQSHIYSLNISKFTRKNEIRYDYRLYKFLKKKQYDIIHINSKVFFFSLRVSIIAKLCGIKKIVVHSHGYYPKYNFFKRFLITIFNPLYRSLVDEYLASSELAKKSLFTQDFINKNKIIVLKNGIDVNLYRFNEKIRKEYRTKLNIEEKIVYGHIGRFSEEKNHKFLIDLFYEIQKRQTNSVLLLIGVGELEDKIKEKVNHLQITEKVFFLGFRNDAHFILNAMDVFIFPSLHEGLGMATIEAQTNGLTTLCSNNIPKEANITKNFKYFNLNDDIGDIANSICRVKNSLQDRENAYKFTIENGYEIGNVCEKLKNIYLKK